MLARIVTEDLPEYFKHIVPTSSEQVCRYSRQLNPAYTCYSSYGMLLLGLDSLRHQA